MISTEFLTASPLFRDLTEAERAQVLIIGTKRSYAPEAVIFREGDAGDGLYIITSGSVRISKRSATGEEALAVLEANAYFGEMALLDQAPRAADAVACEPTEIFFIPVADLRALIETHHQIALKFLYALCEVLTQRLRETNERYMNVFTIAQWGGAATGPMVPLP